MQLMKNALYVKSFLARRRKKKVNLEEYYEQQISCQIPYLSSIFELFLGKREDGLFLEIGANDGVSCSNTWGLAARGWTGFLVEAIPDFAAACVLNHKEHGKVSVYQIAIGSTDGEEVSFNLGGQLTTANQELNMEYQNTDWARSIVTSSQMTLKTQTLDTFIRNHQIQEGFDLLVVDVEGFEAQVFSGFTLAKWRPKMLIVEITDTHPHIRSNAKSDALLGQMIISAEYEIAYKDCINTVFIRRDIWKNTFEL